MLEQLPNPYSIKWSGGAEIQIEKLPDYCDLSWSYDLENGELIVTSATARPNWFVLRIGTDAKGVPMLNLIQVEDGYIYKGSLATGDTILYSGAESTIFGEVIKTAKS